MIGGRGNDLYYVDDPGDLVDENPGNEGAGTDTVRSSITFSLVADDIHVAGDVERLTLTGTADIDGTGNFLANILIGNSGANHLDGGDGRDVIDGAGGNDLITGGVGNDRLTGGLGADTFVFNAVAESNATTASARDYVTDFSTAEGDQLDVHSIDADSVTVGQQAFNFVGTAHFSHTAGELRYAVVNGDAFVYGDTDGNGTADFSIQLHGVTSLAASDFILA